ncbi:MAG: transcriptional regulator [Sphingobacteriales bacterium]|nr:transcriptional regulator [Sphingobacteriales bacterium]
MKELTFEQLPEAISILLEKINHIEGLLSTYIDKSSFNEMLTAREAAALMGITLSRLYKMTHNRELPTYKPGGKKIYFKRQEISDWLSHNRLASSQEIENEAIGYVNRRNRML